MAEVRSCLGYKRCWTAVVGDVNVIETDRRASWALFPDQDTGKLDEVTYSGNGATELLRPVPASMVLDTCGVSSGGWLSNVTVAWAR